MTEDELKKFEIDLLNSQREHIARNERLTKIKQRIRAKDIALVPLWHRELTQIDLSKQRECLDNHHSTNDYILVPSVNLDVLFSKIPPYLRKIFNKKTLFTQDWTDWKNSEVISCWMNGIELIPPTIIFINETNQLFPAEGKHRINVANYFNATELPLLLPKEEAKVILSKLNLIERIF